MNVNSSLCKYAWIAAFSPDGKFVLTRGRDGTARLWDVVTGKEVRLLYVLYWSLILDD